MFFSDLELYDFGNMQGGTAGGQWGFHKPGSGYQSQKGEK